MLFCVCHRIHHCLISSLPDLLDLCFYLLHSLTIVVFCRLAIFITFSVPSTILRDFQSNLIWSSHTYVIYMIINWILLLEELRPREDKSNSHTSSMFWSQISNLETTSKHQLYCLGNDLQLPISEYLSKFSLPGEGIVVTCISTFYEGSSKLIPRVTKDLKPMEYLNFLWELRERKWNTPSCIFLVCGWSSQMEEAGPITGGWELGKRWRQEEETRVSNNRDLVCSFLLNWQLQLL